MFFRTISPYLKKIRLELNLICYAIKSDLKKAIGVDTSNLAAKPDLASLKAEVDKIDIYKPKTLPVDLYKLSNVVENDVRKKL